MLATLSLSWYFTDHLLPAFVKWLLCVAYGMLFTLFAVVCHRLVLLDPAAVARYPVPTWSLRESLFFMWMLAVWFFYLISWVAFLTVAVNALMLASASARAAPSDWHEWLEAGAKVPALYVFARLCPLFPATAVDRRVDLRWAWQLTRGNGWRLVVVVGVLPWVISHLLGLLYRGDPTALETIVLSIAGTALFAVEVAALSISYRELTKEA